MSQLLVSANSTARPASAAQASARGRAGTTASAPTAKTWISAFLLSLGVVLIVLAWYGAAHTPYVVEQVPYVLSGGVAGVALVTAAAAVYLGTWLSAAARQQQQVAVELTAVVAEIRDAFAASPFETRKPDLSGIGSDLVMTAQGSVLHRSDCVVVAGRSDVRTALPGNDSKACALCSPLSENRGSA